MIAFMSAPSLLNSVEHITSTPGVCGGKPRIASTRIRVWDIAVMAQGGSSPDEILLAYSHITLSDVYAALSYYYDHREAIDRQADEDHRFAEELRTRLGPGPLEEKLRQESAS
jgi:uncharacterized protein (DUF433 family)